MSNRAMKFAAFGAIAAVALTGCGSSSSSKASSSSSAPTSAAAPATSAAVAATSAAVATSAAATSGTASAAPATSAASAAPAGSASASAGTGAATGKVGVILPDTVTSKRWENNDRPSLDKALKAAGLTDDIQNADGDASKWLQICQAMIGEKVKVILEVDIDPASPKKCIDAAHAQGIKVIDYDRLSLGAGADYYVSFDNVQVGKLQGEGLVACLKAKGVTKPAIAEIDGAATDNNATLFAQGYNAVMAPYFSSKKWTNVSQPAGTWDPPTALSEFQQQYTAHKNINTALIPNDENAAPIVHFLQGQGVKANTFPVTGQDATLTGLQNILTGYQCGTVYKPIYLEAEAAAALAIYVRAGQTPPSSLVNGQTQDTQSKTTVPSVLLSPTWVTTKNMNSTVIADKFVPAAQLCKGAAAAGCKTAGISS